MSKLSVERTYALRQYENIKLYDEVELPDKEIDNELIQKIRMLQFINLEIAFRSYIKLSEKLHPYSFEDQVGFLEELKVNLIEDINNRKE